MARSKKMNKPKIAYNPKNSYKSNWIHAIKKFQHVKDKDLGKGLSSLTIGLLLMDRNSNKS